ncbi:MAG TPA: hypothetical protein VKJ07_00565 [Mycobacteriales bacterium]|nr:hypothetical protein [Mycobacteriales bacterium]
MQLFDGYAVTAGVDGLCHRAPHTGADRAANAVGLECAAAEDRVIVTRKCMTITLDTARGGLLSF